MLRKLGFKRRKVSHYVPKSHPWTQTFASTPQKPVSKRCSHLQRHFTTQTEPPKEFGWIRKLPVSPDVPSADKYMIASQRKYIDWIIDEFDDLYFDTYEDFFEKVHYDSLKRKINRHMMSHYDHSVQKILQTVYPEFEWPLWRFESSHRIWVHSDTHRRCLDWIAEQIGIEEQSDWYAFTTADILQLGCSSVLSKYGRCLSTALMEVYPEYWWLPWKFRVIPQIDWLNVDNQKRFLDWLAEELGIRDVQEWKQVPQKVIIDHGGRTLLKAFDFSFVQILQNVYPDEDWRIWTMENKQQNIWADTQKVREYLDWFASNFGIEVYEDWCGVLLSQLKHNGGGRLMFRYGSLYNICKAGYPEFDWLMLNSQTVGSAYYWANLENQKQYMEWIGEKLQIRCLNDWANISKEQFKQNGGQVLLDLYNDSLFFVLNGIYPQHKWSQYFTPKTVDDSISSASGDPNRNFFDWIAIQLNVDTQSGWYSITKKDLLYLGAMGILNRFYDGSITKSLRCVYPEFTWYEWLFPTTPAHFWEDRANHVAYVHWLADVLNITKPEDWKSVTTDIALKHGASGVLAYYNSVQELVESTISVVTERNIKFSSPGEIALWYLLKCVTKGQLKVNYKHPNLIHKSTRFMELDFYIPDLQLAFEFQGLQHYTQGYRDFIDDQKERDQDKKLACEEEGISLITVPYWWDGSLATLNSTIQKVRPDVAFVL